ncbi:hypothetical protein ZOD2009_03572 [Haladaptatus paucihalophilus DX253]|uniref:DUF4365 domain-containing protein n=1 Tax=Haladaptatus paucihalophilus DX253 TaxID=797209 RepID=E7QPH6_HALPU|nr:hypothetical protein ZOD2009_03572 [Haladaptatus paucihalophilus DX253]
MGRIIVQIKKLPDEKRDPPRKQLKTNHLAYCRTVSDPFVLIVVDVDNDIGYWKHITPEWFKEKNLDSQKSKTVRFDEENLIAEESDYKIDWMNIIEDTKKRIENYEEYEDLKDRANPAIGETKDRFRNIHLFIDKFNHLLNTDFQVIKEKQYPSVWKFGFGSIDYGEESLHYTLYPIQNNENDAQIRDLDSDWEEIRKLGASRRSGVAGNPIERDPERFAYNAIRKEAEKQIKDRNLSYSNSTFLAKEYVYPFAHKYAPLLGLNRSSEYQVNNIRDGYYRHLQFWLTEEISDILREHSIGEVGVHLEGYLDRKEDPRFATIHESAEKQTQEASTDPPKHRIHGSDFDQEILERMIDVLVESPMTTLTKPYVEKDRARDEVGSVDTIWDLYSDDAIIENAKSYYTNYPYEYQNLLRQNFDSLESEFSYPTTEFLLVIIDIENIRAGMGGGWCIHQFWLESNEDELRVEFHRTTDPEIPEEIEMRMDMLEYGGQDYPIIAQSSSGDHKLMEIARDNKPVFEDVHKALDRDLEAYLREREANIIPGAMR